MRLNLDKMKNSINHNSNTILLNMVSFPGIQSNRHEQETFINVFKTNFESPAVISFFSIPPFFDIFFQANKMIIQC